MRFLNNQRSTGKNVESTLDFPAKKLRGAAASFMMGLLDCIGRSRTNDMAKARAW